MWIQLETQLQLIHKKKVEDDIRVYYGEGYTSEYIMVKADSMKWNDANINKENTGLGEFKDTFHFNSLNRAKY